MTVRLKKIYCILIISLVKVTTISAHTIADTTKLIAGITKKLVAETKDAITVPNVEYPENLQDQKEQSLEYVENFSNKKSAVETVTFVQEKDGKWKAAGYYIK